MAGDRRTRTQRKRKTFSYFSFNEKNQTGKVVNAQSRFVTGESGTLSPIH